jgi:alkanesulfonate monooxygenase SsuD/methylene tetrahydromethanopterin reductase-like flavin-dependent oxidoreductase (luciferase family)
MDEHVQVGTFLPPEALTEPLPQRRALLERIAEQGIDHVAVGDHVSFFTGLGFDGLIYASSLLGAHPTLEVHVGVYLLALRHPTLVARQLADLSILAPGRLVLGVGVGGEDRHEFEVCGVDPATRGVRTDESIDVVRALLTGEPVDHDGAHFSLRDARIVPAPLSPIPIIVGGRSDAAVARAARRGDGWLGIWVSARRFAAVTSDIAEQAAAAGRGDVRWRHGLQLWCGFGPTAEEGRAVLALRMEAMYQTSFDAFAKYSPCGTPADVAEFLAPYIEAGCRSFNLIPCAGDAEEAIAGVAEVRRALS